MNYVVELFRSLMAVFCQFIYPIISHLYNLFINISKVDLLSSDQLRPIYQRVTLILTIVMVFYVTFECVKYIVQPQTMTDKEKGFGNIVYKMVIVVVLIAFVPSIFEWSYKLQNAIIDKNVIGKVILGTNTNVEADKLGSSFSSSLLSIGYTIDDDRINEDCGELKCGTLISMNLNMLTTRNELPYLTMGLDETVKVTAPTANQEKVEVPTIDFAFHGLLAVGIGLFVGYMLISYCVDVGIRWAQMVYLQIIAPIPIIGYLSPKKDGIFQKWVNQCITTYLDLFIRTAIIYFVLLLSSILLDVYHNPSSGDLLSKVNPDLRKWVFIFLILGVMAFIKKAPKMLGELLPKGGVASGNFGLSPKDRNLGKVFGAAAGVAIGAGAGLATGFGQGLRRAKSLDSSAKWYQKAGAGLWGAARGAIGGTVGGATRGLVNGAKKGNVLKNSIAGAQKQMKANQRFGNREENGYGFMDQMNDRVRNLVNAKSRVEVLEDSKAPLKRKQDAYTALTKANDGIRDYAWKKAQDGKSSYIANYRDAEGREKRYSEKTAAELGITEAQRLQYLKEAIDDKKKYKDLATNDYIDKETANDKGLQGMFADRDKDLENYNDYASSSNKVSDTTTEEFKYKDENGVEHTVPVGTKISDLNASALDNYTKILKNKAGDIGRDISEITAEQEAIKRQTSGSGINEGKK